MNPALPRLLLVEDDPVSAAFLCDVAAALPAQVAVAASIGEARAAMASQAFDLLLVDANLPDGRGEDLLRALRETGDATPALAHTADGDADVHARLRGTGFIDVLCKPIDMTGLHAALRRHLPDPAAQPDWDDAAALAALGEQAHVEALRGLFRKELPLQRRRIEAAALAADEASMRMELHRLAASCGFVGAAKLADTVRGLQAEPLNPRRLQHFGSAVEDLLAQIGTNRS